jgi:hypothetical protein
VTESDRFDEPGLLVSAASRTLRRQLRALSWVTLEEVALDAVAEDGRLVARTSARQIAERLRIDPGAAAGALRGLRDRGLLRLEREQGPAGRFGLSIYVIGSVPGLRVVPPCAAKPGVAAPSTEKPAVGDASLLQAAVEGFDPPGLPQPHMGGPHIGERPSPPSLQCPGQAAFELGTASS